MAVRPALLGKDVQDLRVRQSARIDGVEDARDAFVQQRQEHGQEIRKDGDGILPFVHDDGVGPQLAEKIARAVVVRHGHPDARDEDVAERRQDGVSRSLHPRVSAPEKIRRVCLGILVFSPGVDATRTDVEDRTR